MSIGDCSQCIKKLIIKETFLAAYATMIMESEKNLNLMKIKRVYEKPEKDDGVRILVDRLWPRGLTKEKASIDFWLKDIAPSTELRKWFNHEPAKWHEFKKRYRQEIKNNKEQISLLKEQMKKGTVTLVYGAKDEEHNEALVLKELLNS